MKLMLVLFIEGEATYDKYDFPLNENVKIEDPLEVCAHWLGENRTPENLYNLDHEYKIMMVED